MKNLKRDKENDALKFWLDVVTKDVLENIVPCFENDEDYKIREHVRNLKSSCLLARKEFFDSERKAGL